MMEQSQTPPQVSPVDVAPKQTTAQPSTRTLWNCSPAGLVDELEAMLQGDDLPARKQVDLIAHIFETKVAEAASDADADTLASIPLLSQRLKGMVEAYLAQDQKRQSEREELHKALASSLRSLLETLEEKISSDAPWSETYALYQSIESRWQEVRKQLSPQDYRLISSTYTQLRDKLYRMPSADEAIREADFARHLEERKALLAELRELDTHQDIIYANGRMSELTGEWSAMGPIHKGQEAEVFGAYRQLVRSIGSKHQTFHQERKQKETEAIISRTAILDEASAILAGAQPTTREDYRTQIQKLEKLTRRWKALSEVSRRYPSTLRERYDEVLAALKKLRNTYAPLEEELRMEVRSAKQNFIARAEELSKQDDRQSAAEALKALQQEWKSLPHASDPQSDELWAAFRKHFDYFFEQRKDRQASKPTASKGAGKPNQAKQAIIARLEALQALQERPSDLRAQLQAIEGEWRSAGRSRGDDSLYTEYKALLDDLYGKLRQERDQRRLDGYSATLKDKSEDSLQLELRRMERIRASLLSELHSCDVFMMKPGSPLATMLEKKRQSLTEELRLLDEKLALLKVKRK